MLQQAIQYYLYVHLFLEMLQGLHVHSQVDAIQDHLFFPTGCKTMQWRQPTAIERIQQSQPDKQ